MRTPHPLVLTGIAVALALSACVTQKPKRDHGKSMFGEALQTDETIQATDGRWDTQVGLVLPASDEWFVVSKTVREAAFHATRDNDVLTVSTCIEEGHAPSRAQQILDDHAALHRPLGEASAVTVDGVESPMGTFQREDGAIVALALVPNDLYLHVVALVREQPEGETEDVAAALGAELHQIMSATTFGAVTDSKSVAPFSMPRPGLAVKLGDSGIKVPQPGSKWTEGGDATLRVWNREGHSRISYLVVQYASAEAATETIATDASIADYIPGISFDPPEERLIGSVEAAVAPGTLLTPTDFSNDLVVYYVRLDDRLFILIVQALPETLAETEKVAERLISQAMFDEQ